MNLLEWFRIFICALIGTAMLMTILFSYVIILLFVRPFSDVAFFISTIFLMAFYIWFVWGGPFFNVWMKKLFEKVVVRC